MHTFFLPAAGQLDACATPATFDALYQALGAQKYEPEARAAYARAIERFRGAFAVGDYVSCKDAATSWDHGSVEKFSIAGGELLAHFNSNMCAASVENLVRR